MLYYNYFKRRMEKESLKFEYNSNTPERLDVFLSLKLSEYSRSFIQKLVKSGDIKVNKNKVSSSCKLINGDIISVQIPNNELEIKPQNIPLNIIFEDENLAVINKPKNMLTHPTPNNLENTLVNALLFKYGDNLSNACDKTRRGIVHRLDKNTAGLMVIAKNDIAHNNLSNQIKNKTLIRKYRAIVFGEFEEDKGTIDLPLIKNLKDTVKVYVTNKSNPKGKEAITKYKVIERFNGATYIELELKTGRTHQIRCHMAHINHPLVGDTLYGARGFNHKILNKIKTLEQVLQSFYIKLAHPISGDIMEFELKENEWDFDIQNVLKILRENKNE